MVYVRQKEDPWNSIIAGAAAGGFLSLRQGVGLAVRSAVFGGVLLGLIEGVGIMLNKFMPVLQQYMIMLEDDAQANQAATICGHKFSLPETRSPRGIAVETRFLSETPATVST
nr:mitochondrial import inner membrane translocase subunit TIM17-2-like [Tanacetum cinerariifolium]